MDFDVQEFCFCGAVVLEANVVFICITIVIAINTRDLLVTCVDSIDLIGCLSMLLRVVRFSACILSVK